MRTALSNPALRGALAAAVAGLALAALLALAFPAPRARAAETTPAAAAPDACAAAVQRAFAALEGAERFHTRLVVTTPGRRRPAERERFVIGDVAYADSPAAGRWVRMPITPEDRHGLSSAVLHHPPLDCRDAGAAETGGVAARLYTYRQELPALDGADAGPSPPALGRLWVSEADGLPRRWEGERGAVRSALTFDYDRVAPPLAAAR